MRTPKYLALAKGLEGEVNLSMQRTEFRPPVNVVVNVFMGSNLDLFQFARMYGGTSEYKPRDFAGGILRILADDGRKLTVLLFRTTALNLVGYPSASVARMAAHMFRRQVESTGTKAWMSDLKIVNHVCNASFGAPIDLVKLSKRIGTNYDPDQFTGLTYSIKANRVGLKGNNRCTVVLVFSSGSLVIMGTRTFEEFDKVLSHIKKALEECKMEAPDTRKESDKKRSGARKRIQPNGFNKKQDLITIQKIAKDPASFLISLAKKGLISEEAASILSTPLDTDARDPEEEGEGEEEGDQEKRNDPKFSSQTSLQEFVF